MAILITFFLALSLGFLIAKHQTRSREYKEMKFYKDLKYLRKNCECIEVGYYRKGIRRDRYTRWGIVVTLYTKDGMILLNKHAFNHYTAVAKMAEEVKNKL